MVFSFFFFFSFFPDDLGRWSSLAWTFLASAWSLSSLEQWQWWIDSHRWSAEVDAWIDRSRRRFVAGEWTRRRKDDDGEWGERSVASSSAPWFPGEHACKSAYWSKWRCLRTFHCLVSRTVIRVVRSRLNGLSRFASRALTPSPCFSLLSVSRTLRSSPFSLSLEQLHVPDGLAGERNNTDSNGIKLSPLALAAIDLIRLWYHMISPSVCYRGHFCDWTNLIVFEIFLYTYLWIFIKNIFQSNFDASFFHSLDRTTVFVTRRTQQHGEHEPWSLRVWGWGAL